MQRLEDKIRKVMELRAAREKRTPAEQIALLDKKLGVGIGAKRERARLMKLISA